SFPLSNRSYRSFFSPPHFNTHRRPPPPEITHTSNWVASICVQFLEELDPYGGDSNLEEGINWVVVVIGDAMGDGLIQGERDFPMAESGEFVGDSMVCDSASRLVPRGFSRLSCKEEIVMFVNAGGETVEGGDSDVKFEADLYYQGGDVLRTDQLIWEGGDCPLIYQSARFGNFSYLIDNVDPGDYYVDLHFSEIINTNGPKGLRVFNVFIQDEKASSFTVLSDLDIFAVVGAHKPLQFVDSRVSVKEDGKIKITFESILGSPLISGICIRRAPKLSDSEMIHDYIRCPNCAVEVEMPIVQEDARLKYIAKHEKKMEELKLRCRQKTDECSQAWMSLTSANKQLEKVRRELDNCSLQTYSFERKVETQAEEMKVLSNRYEHCKKVWMTTITDLDGRVKRMKQEHAELSQQAHDCADSIPELNNMVFSIQSVVNQCEDLKEKYLEEQTKRKKLYNQIQEAKGNIRVFCRCRPMSRQEQTAGSARVVDFDGANDGEIGIITTGSGKKIFKFDRVFTPKDDQVDVFEDASPMVVSVLDGYNVCIFAYGQTGTGKTFTMEGTPQNRGVNYRTLEQLFEVSRERTDTFQYKISVSVLEVYNGQIRDLLDASPASKKYSPPLLCYIFFLILMSVHDTKQLEIKQASEGFHHVPGIVETEVKNITEVWEVLQTGSNARSVGSNNVNEHSSRSHCILCIMVNSKNLMNGECTKSKLWLVDLAGSERLGKTEVEGERLKEAKNINKSLSALGDVIFALANKSGHVPYRNSKLTHLLQDSLGGDSKTLMFVQISPSEQDVGETLSSLNFASRVCGVELGPARRQIDTGDLQKMKMQLDKAKQEARSKDESIRKLEESLKSLENKARSKDQTFKSQQERNKELEDQLQLKTALHNQMEKQLAQLSEKLKGKEDTCANLQHKVSELEKKLKEQAGDLEKKLRDQSQEHESQSILLQQKIRELEDQLTKNQQQRLMVPILPPIPCSQGATSVANADVKDEVMEETDPFVLRSSDSVNHVKAHVHIPIKVGEPLNETRRKREYRYGETENSTPMSDPLVQDKKIRKSDPPKPFPSQATRPTKPTSIPHRPVNQRGMHRDQVLGAKDKENKKRALLSTGTVQRVKCRMQFVFRSTVTDSNTRFV
ncbi:Kinesin-like protein, partial [Drosera capensis]